MEIKLTNSDKVTIVDDEDWFLFALWKHEWREKWSYSKKFVYIATSVQRSKTLYLHRLITGVNGKRNEVHHEDENPYNNKKSNLKVLEREKHIQEHIKNPKNVTKTKTVCDNIYKDDIPF